MIENKITGQVVDAAIEVHRTLGGPGLLESVLESVYEEALAWELDERGLQVERQKTVPITYKGVKLASPLRIDLLVDNLVIVECKATTNYSPIFQAQLLTYLRLMNPRVGLVINFGEQYVKDGVYRVRN